MAKAQIKTDAVEQKTTRKNKVGDKLSVQVAFVTSEKVNTKLEKQVKKLKIKNKSELMRIICDDYLQNLKA